MTISPIPVAEASDVHLKLTHAHYDAAALARLLHKFLVAVSRPDLPETRQSAIRLGVALAGVARAERACGSGSVQERTFQQYEQMLQQHWQAYLTFEQLSTDLEDTLTSHCSDDALLAAEIGHHLDSAEAAHQASLCGPQSDT
ncbi:MAG: hypothetical protein LAO78_14350 [Acidobacteriia bacterium]|nr:hypothetical protein [Terriglobia bacterium]